MIKKIDLWILLTPYDNEEDFRRETEDNLEYITCTDAIFSKKELR